jgi:hypothetical protein
MNPGYERPSRVAADGSHGRGAQSFAGRLGRLAFAIRPISRRISSRITSVRVRGLTGPHLRAEDSSV